MTILEENHHSFMIVEHDPMLYEDAREMVEYVAQALKQTSREATILLCAPALELLLMRWPWRREAGPIEPRLISRSQGHRAANLPGDTGEGVRCPARRGGGYDTVEAGGEELAGREGKLAGGERGEAMACDFLGGGVAGGLRNSRVA